jgi:hypothetical protein
MREKAASPEWLDGLRIDVNRTGTVTSSSDQHIVAALIDAGIDWRRYATVQLPNHPNPVPYRQVWPDGVFDPNSARPDVEVGSPDPCLPSLPRTVDLPQRVYQLVRAWADEEVAAGRLVLAAPLPSPAARGSFGRRRD